MCIFFCCVSELVSFKFHAFLAPCVYPSPSAKQFAGVYSGGSVLVHKRHITPSVSKLAVWNSACCEMIQCTSEDMRIVMPCWYHEKLEHCIRKEPHSLLTSHSGVADLTP